MTILVALTVLIGALLILNLTLLFTMFVSKLVPLIVTEVPGVPMLGVNPVMVGVPFEPFTVKGTVLLHDVNC